MADAFDSPARPACPDLSAATRSRPPWSTSQGLRAAATIAVLSRATVSAGVLAGAKTAYHPDLFNRIVGNFIVQVEAGRWPKRDLRAMSASITGISQRCGEDRLPITRIQIRTPTFCLLRASRYAHRQIESPAEKS